MATDIKKRELASVLLEINANVTALVKVNPKPETQHCIHLFRQVGNEYYGRLIDTNVINSKAKFNNLEYKTGDRFVLIDIANFRREESIRMSFCIVHGTEFVTEASCTYGLKILNTTGIHVYEYLTAGTIPPYTLYQTKN